MLLFLPVIIANISSTNNERTVRYIPEKHPELLSPLGGVI